MSTDSSASIQQVVYKAPVQTALTRGSGTCHPKLKFHFEPREPFESHTYKDITILEHSPFFKKKKKTSRKAFPYL